MSFYHESLRFGREVDDKQVVADASCGLGTVHAVFGNTAEGRTHLEEVIRLAREMGNPPLAAKALNNLGECARSDGDFETARRFYEESLAENAAAPDAPLASIVCYNLGNIALRAGDLPRAREYFRSSLDAAREMGFMIGIHAGLEGFEMLAVFEGRMRRAARLLGATAALGAELGMIPEPNDEALQRPLRDAARAELGDEAFDAATLEGRAMRVEEAIALAQEGSAPE
jgi:tetratricopeptide (TPR) repeat protein